MPFFTVAEMHAADLQAVPAQPFRQHVGPSHRLESAVEARLAAVPPQTRARRQTRLLTIFRVEMCRPIPFRLGNPAPDL